LVGALAGDAIDPQTYGLDGAFPAAFVAMLWPLLRTRQGRRASTVGAAICVATIPFLPLGVPLLCATLAIAVGIRPDAPEVTA
jgi:predicted branched-subunit amino acid permease